MYDRPEVRLLDRWLVSHRAARFGQVVVGPLRRRAPNFGVITFEPLDPGGPWVYLSTRLERGGVATSFFTLSEGPQRGHVRTLTLLGWCHVAGEVPPLAQGAVVPVGRPWTPHSSLTWVLVSDPYPLGPGWRALRLEEPAWRLLWAQPISHQEAGFARRFGVQALQQRFTLAGVRFASTSRASVV